MIYFKLKIQLKFRHNKNYSTISFNMFTLKHISLTLKCRNNKSNHEKRTASLHVPYYSFLSCCNHSGAKGLGSVSSTSLRSVFRIRLIPDPFRSTAPVIWVLFLQIVWIVEFTRQKFPTHRLFLFILYLSYPFNFSFDAQNLPFTRDCSHVIKVPVSCY
jgi:hypothetical protein